MSQLRVAFFTDSFHEVNGVAQTSRQFDAFHRRQRIPLLRVNAAFAGSKTVGDSIIRSVELQRGRAAFPVEKDMAFDPFFMRHRQLVRQAYDDSLK